MKLVVGLLVLAAFCYQDAFAANCEGGNANPWVCQCELFTADTESETPVKSMLLVPNIAVEEFEPKVPGRWRKSKTNFLEYCTKQCLCRLRARLLDDAPSYDPAKTSEAISANGWNTLCDLLYNPTNEVAAGGGTTVVGDDMLHHYWLKVSRRDCEPVNCLLYLGSNSCDCFTITPPALDVCYSTGNLGALAVGAVTYTVL